MKGLVILIAALVTYYITKNIRVPYDIDLEEDEEDYNPTPYFTLIFIILCIATSILGGGNKDIIFKFGCIPAEIFNNFRLHPLFGHSFAFVTLLTDAFLHVSPIHLIMNMIFFWMFGRFLEIEFGWIYVPVFIFLGAIASSLGFCLFNPTLQIPAIGASGFISAIMGGLIVVAPNLPISAVMIFPSLMGDPDGPAEVSAWKIILLWFAIQLILLLALGMGNEATGIGYSAHVVGFVFGAAAAWTLLRLGMSKAYD